MRKRLTWVVAAALAVVVSAAGIASATDSTGTNYSLLKMKVTPSKLSKKKFKPVKKLFVDTSTLNNNNGGTPTNPNISPAPTTKVVLTFDKNIKFTSKGLAQCNSATIVNDNTSQARSACKKSMVGSGSATACVVGGATGVPCANTFQQTVSAFNGKPKGGKPTIVLHSWSAALPLPVVLTGTLDQKKNTLTVPLPPNVYSAATITDFKTTVGKKYKKGKKKLSYVTARCPKGKLSLKGVFSYKGDPADHVKAPPAKCKA
jgi:hypothetical protein